MFVANCGRKEYQQSRTTRKARIVASRHHSPMASSTASTSERGTARQASMDSQRITA